MTTPPGFPADPPYLQKHNWRDVDADKASTARMYDYYLGGKDNFPADREAAEQVMAVMPDVGVYARGNREFLRRTVRFVAEQGVDQFIDLGTGIPTVGPTHEVAQQARPGARIAYVDNDPVVLAHARALLTALGDDRTVGYVDHDISDPHGMLAAPEMRELIDFNRPVGVFMIGVLHFIEDPTSVIDTVMRAMPPGSWLAISAISDDTSARNATRAYEKATSQLRPRPVAEIAKLFHGVELAEPGVVQLHQWRPDEDAKHPCPVGYGGVGVKR